MLMNFNERMNALPWFLGELQLHWNKHRDVELLHQMLRGAPEDDRWYLLSALFSDAMSRNDWELASACCQEGFEIEPNDSADPGPLHDSITYLCDHPEPIRWLIQMGANVERRSFCNAAPLHRAAGAGFIKVAQELLKAGADVNVRTILDNDETPLMIAAGQGNRKMAELLLANGADPSLRDRWNRNSADFARAKGHAEMAELMDSILKKGERLAEKWHRP
jgi:Ankyrin repeats (3 copies)